MLIKRIRFIPNNATGKQNTCPYAPSATRHGEFRRRIGDTPFAISGRQVRCALSEAIEGRTRRSVFLLNSIRIRPFKSPCCLIWKFIKNGPQSSVESTTVQNRRIPQRDIDLVPRPLFHFREEEPIRVAQQTLVVPNHSLFRCGTRRGYG